MADVHRRRPRARERPRAGRRCRVPRPRGDHADAARGGRRHDRGARRRPATRRRCTPPGRRARRVVEESRERIAAALGARPSEVVFTGGGTEADNLAVKGIFWARRAADPRRRRVLVAARSSTTPCSTRCDWLASHEGAERRAGCRSTTLGRVAPARCAPRSSRDPDAVALVTVMWANNEVGTVQPVAELAAVAPGARHPVPHRRGPGRRAAAGRLRRQRRRPR